MRGPLNPRLHVFVAGEVAVRMLHHHRRMGWLGVVVFLLSGQYMHWRLDHLHGMDEAHRLLYRSTHIYLLLASLVNLGLGTSDPPILVGWRRLVRGVGSWAILMAPILFAIAFWEEPNLTGLARPWTRPGVFACFGGTILYALSSMGARRRFNESSAPANDPIAGQPFA